MKYGLLCLLIAILLSAMVFGVAYGDYTCPPTDIPPTDEWTPTSPPPEDTATPIPTYPAPTDTPIAEPTPTGTDLPPTLETPENPPTSSETPRVGRNPTKTPIITPTLPVTGFFDDNPLLPTVFLGFFFFIVAFLLWLRRYLIRREG